MNTMSINDQQGSYYHHKTLEDTKRIEAFTRGPSLSQTLHYTPRILVVDDEKIIRTMIKRSLEIQLGAEVVMACNGLQATEFIAQDSFDLVISDMQMPTMTGLELYEWICLNAPQLKDYFFVISGDLGSIKVANELQDHGIQLIRKPFHISSLINTVLQHLPIGREAEKVAV